MCVCYVTDVMWFAYVLNKVLFTKNEEKNEEEGTERISAIFVRSKSAVQG